MKKVDLKIMIMGGTYRNKKSAKKKEEIKEAVENILNNKAKLTMGDLQFFNCYFLINTSILDDKDKAELLLDLIRKYRSGDNGLEV